jgi:hypothetical protein
MATIASVFSGTNNKYFLLVLVGEFDDLIDMAYEIGG